MTGVFKFLIYLFRKDRNYYHNLIRILGFFPRHVSLYRTAFTHKSASIVLKDGTRMNNERLEYLGDAVLGAIVAEYIYMEFDHSDEGFMTKLRSRIVKRKNLDSTAIKMGIPMMISSHPKPANTSKHLYGNALEALIGAIYLDRGYSKASWFFKHQMVNRHIDMVAMVKRDSDYKSQLIEWAQKEKQEVLFNTIEDKDPNTKSPVFKSELIIAGSSRGFGHGGSKKEAEQQAAKVALKEIK